MQKILNDNELIEKIREDGDSDAFAEISNRHSGLAVKVINRYRKSFAKVGVPLSDILANKDVYIFQAINTFKAEKGFKFSTWLGNNVRFFCLNELRSLNRRGLPQAKNEDNEPFLEESQDAEVKKKDIIAMGHIEKVLNGIKDPKIKRIFKLRFIDELKWKEIGKILDISPSSALYYFSKGKRLIRKALNLDEENRLERTNSRLCMV